MIRLGLTGGIGSGKSTAAAFFHKLGAAHIDADAIARQMTLTGGIAIPMIKHHFGSGLIDASGAMDRGRMRELAFGAPEKKALLESILHPLIRQTMAEQMASAAASDRKLLVLDIPLLTEDDYWLDQVDCVCVIDCQETTQMQRVRQRSGLSEIQIQAIMSQQSKRLHRVACADICINNETSIDALMRQVESVCTEFGL